MILPEIDEAAYLVELWRKAGTVESTGMGVMRLSWKEIESWLNVREQTGELPLLYWEVDLIRRMSEEYSSEYCQASDKNRPAPYTPEEFERDVVATKISTFLSNFGKRETNENRYEEEE